MPDVLKKADIDATISRSESNQPLHGASNFTMNYVIYAGRPGPWEAHRDCVDIYFMQSGNGTAHLGGEIVNAKEETPGEIRGTGVKGARTHQIGPGDIVLIPRMGTHYMVPSSVKLAYLLMKVWAE
jgi:mannose-6-phosphate isomerase-like protein (cupin superfamily)